MFVFFCFNSFSFIHLHAVSAEAKCLLPGRFLIKTFFFLSLTQNWETNPTWPSVLTLHLWRQNFLPAHQVRSVFAGLTGFSGPLWHWTTEQSHNRVSVILQRLDVNETPFRGEQIARFWGSAAELFISNRTASQIWWYLWSWVDVFWLRHFLFEPKCSHVHEGRSPFL